MSDGYDVSNPIGNGADPLADLEPDQRDVLAAEQIPTEAITGFAVVMGKGGEWFATSRLDLAALIEITRQAGFADFIVGGRAVAEDALQIRLVSTISEVLAQVPAQTTGQIMNAMQHQAVKMAEAQQSAQILQRVQERPRR